jgi:hypothetical protein
MTEPQTALSKTFTAFFETEKSGGILLIVCTIVSLVIANSAAGPAYLTFWHIRVAGLSMEHWINDALMAVFFLFVGLELERELYSGELANFKNALLPIFAAAGGIALPALLALSRSWVQPVLITIPVLASAKIGRMTNATGLCRKCSSRCDGDASSSAFAENGMANARSTPAIVACTPDFSIRNHISAPPSRYQESDIARNTRLQASSPANTASAADR